ncbi:MAG: DUF2723 domain-containing protein [Candidatus Kapabacteria bacterium]|jgi:hypothetical protein|nr:DUF2723 domain-containing protein [Candidatus Kapabacteria bacterium]
MKISSKSIYSLLIFIISAMVFYSTAAPGLMYTDSGELAAVCSTLGVAHPTGYPLFTILGHLWTLLPLPFSTIYSLNIFAATVTALSSVVFFNMMYLIFSMIRSHTIGSKSKSKDKKKKKVQTVTDSYEDSSLLIMSAATALMYSFALTVWQQATALEVYSLHLLMIHLVLYMTTKGLSEPAEKKYFVLSAFLLGASFSNHMTTILLVPGLLFIYFARPFDKTDGKMFSADRMKFAAFLLIPFIIGLSFYLYLPLRSASGPEFNWGEVSRGWDKFLYHVQGKQYQIWMFSDSDVWKTNLQKFFELLPAQTAFIGIPAALWGIIKLFKTSKSFTVALLIFIVSCLSYSVNYSIHDIDSYFLTAFSMIIILAGIGFYYIFEKSAKFIPLMFALPLIALIMNYSEADLSDNRIVPEYTEALFDNLDENAIVISSQWDYACSAFWYKQSVENYRPDIVLIEQPMLRRTWYPGLVKSWYPDALDRCSDEIRSFLEICELFESEKEYSSTEIQKRFIDMLNSFVDKNYDERPIYITSDILQTEPDIGKDYTKIPEGLAFRLLRKEDAYTNEIRIPDVTELAKQIQASKGHHLAEGIRALTALNLNNLGRMAIRRKESEKVRKAYEGALMIEPTNREAIRVLGLLK